VADLAIAATNSGLVVPQFADGGGYINAIILLNTSNAVESGTIRFRNDSRTDSPVTIGGVTSPSFTYNNPPAGAAVFETSGTGPSPIVGYIDVTPDVGTILLQALEYFALYRTE
jgi:hypothetical protein